MVRKNRGRRTEKEKTYMVRCGRGERNEGDTQTRYDSKVTPYQYVSCLLGGGVLQRNTFREKGSTHKQSS